MAGASIWWSDVKRMLSACAPGWTEELKLHHRWIRYAGKVWIKLPKGAGTGGRDYQVAGWQVRRMAEALGISMKCAKEHLPALGPVKPTDT
jgi:hypothetical protein